jgi:hypothetical protein
VLPPFRPRRYGALFALGSGATRQRRRGALLPLNAKGPVTDTRRSIDLAPWFEPIEDAVDELNVECAVIANGRLIFCSAATRAGNQRCGEAAVRSRPGRTGGRLHERTAVRFGARRFGPSSGWAGARLNQAERIAALAAMQRPRVIAALYRQLPMQTWRKMGSKKRTLILVGRNADQRPSRTQALTTTAARVLFLRPIFFRYANDEDVALTAADACTAGNSTVTCVPPSTSVLNTPSSCAVIVLISCKPSELPG